MIRGEEEKRRMALEIQATMLQKYGLGSVTQAEGMEPACVTPGPFPAQSAAEGRVGPCGRSGNGQKIASSSAGARAPEARAEASRNGTKTKPNRRENEFMLNLMILRNTLRVNAPACRERARRAGRWVWRDMMLLLSLVNRIQDQLLATMPESRDEYYSAYARHGHYELRIDGPIRTSRHLLVTDKHLASLAEAAMKSECILCMREGSEIGQCELREALLESAVPTVIDESDSLFRKCEYRDAAGALVQGKDVSI